MTKSDTNAPEPGDLDVEEPWRSFEPETRVWQFEWRKLLVPVALLVFGLTTYGRQLHLAWRDRQIMEELTAKLSDFEPRCTYHEGRAIALGFRSGDKLLGDDLVYLAELTGLWSLDLNDTQVTDAGLIHLEGLTSLEHLKLDGTEISDVGAKRLSRMGKLESLSLRDTHITDEGMKKLKQALPNCLVIHDFPLPHSLEHLKGLSKLQHLCLNKTQVTGPGLE